MEASHCSARPKFCQGLEVLLYVVVGLFALACFAPSDDDEASDEPEEVQQSSEVTRESATSAEDNPLGPDDADPFAREEMIAEIREDLVNEEFSTAERKLDRLESAGVTGSEIEGLREEYGEAFRESRLGNARDWLEGLRKTLTEGEKASLEEVREAYNESANAIHNLEQIPRTQHNQEVRSLLEQADQLQAEAVDRLLDAFRAHTPKNRIEAADVELRIRRVRIADSWAFDRYRNRYHYRESDKDKKFLVVDVDITSEEKNPVLPEFVVHRIKDDGSFESLGGLELRYFRWQDYGSYLGNHHDFRNDFAKRDTVRFTAGRQVDMDDLYDPVVLGVSTLKCLSQRYERFDRPPLSWHSGCRHGDLEDPSLYLWDFYIVRVFTEDEIPEAIPPNSQR